MKSEKNFDSDEKSRISKLLNKKLAPEYISYRQGFNRTVVPYVEGWTVISLANQIFGFNGWSSQIIKMEIDYCDENDNKWCIGISCIVRISLKDGTSKEDVGFGSSENQRRKSEAYEKARKEAVTDALKRALRQYGNSLGNCCYDKNFINSVKKIEKKERDYINAKDLYRKENNASFSKRAKKKDEDSMDFEAFTLSNN
ncbi:DNA repair and recombination protein RAD52 (RAD52) [Vairimorpha necatrix]|uniref:DNA repair and recombination protein RAD52 (RAD52) n=1 Tax=Vairimorpha necatrix TaxID=6039 RepID=A0AAX4JAE4_9MICR